MGKTAEKKDPDRDRVDADRCWKSWSVTYGQVLLVSSADAVMATPRAAMAAIFCSKMSSNDVSTLEAAPKNLCDENIGVGPELAQSRFYRISKVQRRRI